MTRSSKRLLALVLSSLSIAALVLLLLCLPAARGGPVPLFIYAGLMAGAALSAFWNTHDLFARRPFPLYVETRRRVSGCVTRIVRPGRMLAALFWLLLALGLLFAAWALRGTIARGEWLFALLEAAVFGLYAAACAVLLRTCVGRRRAALYLFEEGEEGGEGPAWDESGPEVVHGEVRRGRALALLQAAIVLLGAAALAVAAVSSILRGAAWWTIAFMLVVLALLTWVGAGIAREVKHASPRAVVKVVERPRGREQR